MTTTQQEILKLIKDECLTPPQIAERRKTSRQAVYKILKKLEEKGFYDPKRGGVDKTRCTLGMGGLTTPISYGKKVRLHGQEFNCKILSKTDSYDRLRAAKTSFSFKGHTIRLFRNSLEIYCTPNKSFFGEDEQEATSKSVYYWNHIFAELEQKLNIIILKGENTRIKEVNSHYSLMNNELAKDMNDKKEKLRIKAKEDGKNWFSIDNSWNLHEAETLHPETSKSDMEKVRTFFNDIRHNNPPVTSEIWQIVALHIKNFDMYAENMKSHVLAVQKLGTGVDELIIAVKQLQKELE